MRHLTLLAIALASSLPLHAQRPRQPMVVVISLDAFGAASLRDPDVPAPTLRSLMNSGAYARSMQPINPTVTWPNHTSMVTGVDALRHFVMLNGLVENGREPDKKLSIDFPSSKTSLVHAPTVYDIAHAAGLTTAEVDWVAIHDARTIDFPFEEYPDANAQIVKEMLANGSLSSSDLAAFTNHCPQPRRDELFTAAAVHIIKQHHPNLLLLHYLDLDSTEHTYGINTLAGASAIAFLDAQVKQVVEAVKEAGDLDRTTFLIVSDHGQMSVNSAVRPEVILQQSGVTPDEATAVAEGGFAYVYIRAKNKKKYGEQVARLTRVFENSDGVDSVVTPEGFKALGFAEPSVNAQSPDLMVFAKPGFSMTEGAEGPAVERLPAQLGAHGYRNTDPLMQQIFIAWGRNIRTAGQIGPISVLDLAPTIATLLGLHMENVQGHVLSDVLR